MPAYANIFSRLVNASKYSIQGIFHALRNEQAFQYEFAVFIILCAALFVFGINIFWSIVFLASWLSVMILELINSAVEKVFDMIDKNFSPEIKAGKDMLSSAVFLAVCFNIFLWGAYIVII